MAASRDIARRDRLDGLLARHAGLTRREAAAVIRRGMVACDGQKVRKPATRVDPARQEVTLRGEPVSWRARTVILLNKPAGVVSATTDRIHRAVLDLIPAALKVRDLAPVGRLDLDTTGLLLLTDDGDLNHRLTHPRRHLARVYLATLDPGPDGLSGLAPDAEERFAAGLVLGDGTRCKSARLDSVAADRARVTVHEGRYHQVKRMLAACGARVAALHRESVGPLELDPKLPPGACRLLSEAEIAALEEATRAPSPPR